MANPLEAARNIKTQTEEENKKKEQEALELKNSNLIQKLGEERTLKKTHRESQETLNQKQEELKNKILEKKTTRSGLKKLGKEAAQELRKDEVGQSILKNPEKRNQVFGETIEKLKEIKEELKPYFVELNQISEQDQKDRKVFRDLKQKRLNEFLQSHPEVGEIQKKLGYIQESQNFYKNQLLEVEDFLSDESYRSHLNDEILYDQRKYHLINDVTLEKHLKGLDEELSSVREEISSLQSKFYRLKKGFFESEDSFKKKKDALWKQMKDVEYAKENPIFHRKDGIHKSHELKEKLEKSLKSFLYDLTSLPGYRKGENKTVIDQANTVKGLATMYKEALQKQLENSRLSEEEQVLIDLNNELWNY